MTGSSVEELLDIFGASDPERAIAFIRSHSSLRQSDLAMLAAQSSRPEMRFQALDFLAGGCCSQGPYPLGAALGECCYRLARQGFDEGRGDSTTLRMIAGRSVLNWMTCLQRTGRHREVLVKIMEPLTWLEAVSDRDSLDMLRLKRIEAELDLEQYDNADTELRKIDSLNLPPIVAVTYNALRTRADQHRGGAKQIPGEYDPSPEDVLRKIMQPVTGHRTRQPEPRDGKKGATKKGAKSGDRTKSKPSSSAASKSKGRSRAAKGKKNAVSGDIFDSLKGVAGLVVGRTFGGAAGAINEHTVGQSIIDASWIFRDPKKGSDPAEIRRVEPILIRGRDWMLANGFADAENDARWALYLCYNRTGRYALAADELSHVRQNIERARSGIADPLERARLSERYPFLHASLVMLSYRLEKKADLLRSIEASKGRALADLLTIRDGNPADETQFTRAIDELGGLLQRLQSHYLTVFVDDDSVYCALLASNGETYTHRVDIPRSKLVALAEIADPHLWGTKSPQDPLGPRNPTDVDDLFSPLVSWMSPLLQSGILSEGDHLCYSPHDCLLLVPFHYIQLQGRPLVSYFSISRAHGAHSLCEQLRRTPSRPTSWIAAIVPAVQDLEDTDKVTAFEAAGRWLRDRLPGGETLDREKADIASLARKNLRERVIHFSTHGRFPGSGPSASDPNPFVSSALVLSSEGHLPDLAAIARGKKESHLLTPARIVDMKLDFTDSHLTLQACVSGLARRGVGGDSLGLEWAFLQLGAASILSTHWYVSAQETARFACRFYDLWLIGGKTRAEAWRAAVLELQESSGAQNAYHWAAFSLSGDWR